MAAPASRQKFLLLIQLDSSACAMARILLSVLRVRRNDVEFVMVSSVGIGSSLGLQQPNPLNYNLATGDVTNSPATSLLSFLNAPSTAPSDPASTSSTTSGSSAPQAFDASLQAFLVQLQSALGNGATGQSAPADRQSARSNFRAGEYGRRCRWRSRRQPGSGWAGDRSSSWSSPS